MAEGSGNCKFIIYNCNILRTPILGTVHCTLYHQSPYISVTPLAWHLAAETCICFVRLTCGLCLIYYSSKVGPGVA